MSKIIVGVVIVVVAGAGYFLLNRETEPEVVVTNFEECAAAGNPVMESYPRKCAHKGVTYVEELDQPVNNAQ